MTTKVEIADLASIIRSGYPEAAEAYRRDCEVLATIRSTPGMAEHEADAMHNANCRSKTCAGYTQRLGALANLVTKHLPELWPDLHLVGSGDRWHDDQAFDWPAAEKELRTIEAVAVGKDGADVASAAEGANSANTSTLFPGDVPKDPRLVVLREKLNHNAAKPENERQTNRAIARELTGEPVKSCGKAISLLAQLNTIDRNHREKS